MCVSLKQLSRTMNTCSLLEKIRSKLKSATISVISTCSPILPIVILVVRTNICVRHQLKALDNATMGLINRKLKSTTVQDRIKCCLLA